MAALAPVNTVATPAASALASAKLLNTVAAMLPTRPHAIDRPRPVPRRRTGLSEPEDLFSDYLELWVQVALFSMVFPLAPLLALANNVLEIRLDAFKMLRTCRRALPVRASGSQIRSVSVHPHEAHARF